MHLEQANWLVESCELFHGLRADEVLELVGELESVEYPPGKVIFSRGSHGDAFYLVLEGLVDVVVPVVGVPGKSGRAREIVVSTVGPAGFFGEIACLESEGRRTASAMARTECRLLAVPRDRFLAFLKGHPNASLAVVRYLGGRVRHYSDIYAGIRNTNDLVEERRSVRTLWERCSDYMTEWSARWSFTRANLLLWAVWLGTVGALHWFAGRSQAAAFGVNALTLWVSLQTIIMTTFILVSQKRTQEVSNLQEEQHYLAAITTRETTHFLLERLERLERRLERRG